MSLWKRIRHKIVGLVLSRTRKTPSSLPPSSPSVFGNFSLKYHVPDERFACTFRGHELVLRRAVGKVSGGSRASSVSARMFTERTKTKGEHVVLEVRGLQCRAALIEPRRQHEVSVSISSGHQCRAAHTHPPPFSDHAVSCSTELVVGLECQQDRKVTPMPSGLSDSANARALVPILQVSLSSSCSLTPYVGIPAGYIHRCCVAEAVLRRHTRVVVPIVSGLILSDEVQRLIQRYLMLGVGGHVATSEWPRSPFPN